MEFGNRPRVCFAFLGYLASRLDWLRKFSEHAGQTYDIHSLLFALFGHRTWMRVFDE